MVLEVWDGQNKDKVVSWKVNEWLKLRILCCKLQITNIKRLDCNYKKCILLITKHSSRRGLCWWLELIKEKVCFYLKLPISWSNHSFLSLSISHVTVIYLSSPLPSRRQVMLCTYWTNWESKSCQNSWVRMIEVSQCLSHLLTAAH